MNVSSQIQSLYDDLRSRLGDTLHGDRRLLARELRAVERMTGEGSSPEKAMKKLHALTQKVDRAVRKRKSREAGRPAVTYPGLLPITVKKNEIVSAIRRHRVVVITGETGSGKTTQIPKMCIEAGRGIHGCIGCTQPRRIATVAVAERIAAELGEPPGRSVGYKIRFEDRSQAGNYIKVMTDGVLLMETQYDRYLNAYDTIIIDEAHERSINIDFTLGILKELMGARRDLKLIITSATINPETFSRAFDNAPIIEVSGRMFPVELRYRPIDREMEEAGATSYIDAAVAAANEIEGARTGGDMLIFMPTEQDIRETCDLLTARKKSNAVVLPLFARLPQADQRRVFQPTGTRKIIVATNVAETSLTIPGIRFVIDTGLARIADYNPATRTKRLPITTIAKSSAIQRQGRCGRVEDGICIRLYSKEEFESRPAFTPPEVLRSNLAEVILRMVSLGIGDVDSFPFIDPPSRRTFSDGFTILKELGALAQEHPRAVLTETGRKMARLPMDPRIARIIMEAERQGCIEEVVIIASALSIQDPRERPPGREKEADEAHKPFIDPKSDFMTLLTIWRKYRDTWKRLVTQKRLRRFCIEHFLSYRRMREWADVHEEITGILKEMGHVTGGRKKPLEGNALYAGIHKAILSGYLSNIAVKKEKNIYRSARGRDVMIFPGSGTFGRAGEWIVSAEIVETTRVFARTAAVIEGAWLEEAGRDLCRSTYTEPHWEKDAGAVIAIERVSLFGFVIVPGRSVPYGPVDPGEATGIFIRKGIVPGDLKESFPFLTHNRSLIETATAMEDKLRKKNILAHDEDLAAFYQSRLGHVYDIETLRKEIAGRGGDDFLKMTVADVIRSSPEEELSQFPDAITLGGQKLPLSYRFDPGSSEDGVTVRVPSRLTAHIPLESADWQIPGFVRERITALLKGLPKEYRRKLVPIPQTVDLIVREMDMSGVSLLASLARFINDRFKVSIPAVAWPLDSIPEYLKTRFSVVDAAGREVRSGRNPDDIRSHGEVGPPPALLQKVRSRWEKTHLTAWNFGDMPETIGVPVKDEPAFTLYPALEAGEGHVSLRLFEHGEEARRSHREGVVMLYSLTFRKEIAVLAKYLTLPDDCRAAARHFGGAPALESLLVRKTMEQLFNRDIRTETLFREHGEAVRPMILSTGQDCLREIQPVLDAYHDTWRAIRALIPSNRGNPAAVAFIEARLAEIAVLMPKDFPLRYDGNTLTMLPRYLNVASRRAERGTVHIEKDRIKEAKVEPFSKALDRLMETLPSFSSAEKKEAVERFRWMIEEYKVSLFAPEIKTLYPVSPKRLSETLHEIERMI